MYTIYQRRDRVDIVQFLQSDLPKPWKKDTYILYPTITSSGISSRDYVMLSNVIVLRELKK